MNGGTDFISFIDRIAEKIAEDKKDDKDYLGKDGLLYCGHCHTRKQGLATWHNGEKKVVPISCECRKEKLKKEQDLEAIEQLRERSNIEPKFLGCTFDSIEVNSDNGRNVNLCKRYVDKFQELYKANQGLLFYGDVGTGKSMLAHCIANELMNRFRSVASISLAKILKAGFKDADEEEAIMRKVTGVDLLIFDDLGAERETDYAKEFVYSVVDTRCNTKKPMIVTTNLTLADMQNCNDIRNKRTYDRILEICYPVIFTGVSWRMRNAANRYDKVTQMLEGD